jgi:release factor glutamine methyltransferase
MLTLRNYIENTIQALQKNYEPNEASEIAYMLVDYFFGASKLDVLLGKQIKKNELVQYNSFIKRLQNNEPIQYVLGYAWFLNKKYRVNPHVLIPRPETEEMVNLIIDQNREIDHISIVDVGTGSGCIAISLANSLKTENVIGIDISEAALEVASQNANSQIFKPKFHCVDMEDLPSMLAKVKTKIDVLVSNPPYVLETEKSQMKMNVLEHEPHLALFVANENPLRYYEACLKMAQLLFHNNSKIYFEINALLGYETKILLEKYGFSDVSIHKDFNNKDRFASAVWLR